jgi:hypothetical protein
VDQQLVEGDLGRAGKGGKVAGQLVLEPDLASCTRSRRAAAVNCLVTEASRKGLSGVSGAWCSILARP